MMAPAHSDGPTDGRFPSAEALTLLREAMRAYLRGAQSPAEEAAVCDALVVLAREARERRLHGEHVLLVLKDAWSNMAEVSSISDRRERQRILSRLVTLCIDVYYQQR